MSKKKIPKGWIDYLPYGDKVEGTNIFPFKTPLKLELQYNIPRVQRFTPACLIANRPNLRAVIDLTDTDVKADRYYSPKDFTDAKIEHLKLRITGGGLVPGRDLIKMFSDAVDNFLEQFSDDPDALIGVHCTHGLNRTGYFICMYMVTRMKFSPMSAIENFQRARGYVMYRRNFIEEIMEPGKYTTGPQTPHYGEANKEIRPVGNYKYENTWLEVKSKRPFKGFSESEIREGNREAGRAYGDRGNGRRRRHDRRRWREGKKTSDFPRDEDLKRRQPLYEGDQEGAGLPIEMGPFPIESNYSGVSHQHRMEQLRPKVGWRQNEINMTGRPNPFAGGRRTENTSVEMDTSPVERIQNGQGFPHGREQFPMDQFYNPVNFLPHRYDQYLPIRAFDGSHFEQSSSRLQEQHNVSNQERCENQRRLKDEDGFEVVHYHRGHIRPNGRNT